MNHEQLENISHVQDSSLVCASFATTQEEVDQATRVEEGATGKVFYQVTDWNASEDCRVDMLPSGVIECSCGEPIECWHRRAACAANVLYDMERVERKEIEDLIRKGYTRESVEAHVMHGAPLVESPEGNEVTVVYTGIDAAAIAPIAPSHSEVVRDPYWEAEQRKVQAREQRAVRRYGLKAYDTESFSFLR